MCSIWNSFRLLLNLNPTLISELLYVRLCSLGLRRLMLQGRRPSASTYLSPNRKPSKRSRCAIGVLCFVRYDSLPKQVRLVRELEKKFSGRPVVFIAQRRILSKPKRNQRTKQKQLRPRRYVCLLTLSLWSHVVVLPCHSRTLTSVHDAILEDLVHPAEIVGKRIRVKMDGTRLIKV